MNAHTPHSVIRATHCKRLALRAAVIAVKRKIAAEIKAAKELKKEKK